MSRYSITRYQRPPWRRAWFAWMERDEWDTWSPPSRFILAMPTRAWTRRGLMKMIGRRWPDGERVDGIQPVRRNV